MSEEISLDGIEKMLQEATGHRFDATPMAAVRVAIETLVLQQSPLWEHAPTPLVEAHLGNLVSLAAQLLDTGGRMRLHPEGQLDVPAPWATSDDMKSLELKVRSLASAILAAQAPADTTELLAVEDRIMAKLEELRRQPDIDAIMAELRKDPAVLIKRTRTFGDLEGREPGDDREVLPDVVAKMPTADQKGKKGKFPTAGNFVNPDGTITCRICGLSKETGDYYKDKNAATGFKSACKSCEQKQKKAAA